MNVGSSIYVKEGGHLSVALVPVVARVRTDTGLLELAGESDEVCLRDIAMDYSFVSSAAFFSPSSPASFSFAASLSALFLFFLSFLSFCFTHDILHSSVV
jgi:hypothetical protein